MGQKLVHLILMKNRNKRTCSLSLEASSYLQVAAWRGFRQGSSLPNCPSHWLSFSQTKFFIPPLRSLLKCSPFSTFPMAIRPYQQTSYLGLRRNGTWDKCLGAGNTVQLLNKTQNTCQDLAPTCLPSFISFHSCLCKAIILRHPTSYPWSCPALFCFLAFRHTVLTSLAVLTPIHPSNFSSDTASLRKPSLLISVWVWCPCHASP